MREEKEHRPNRFRNFAFGIALVAGTVFNLEVVTANQDNPEHLASPEAVVAAVVGGMAVTGATYNGIMFASNLLSRREDEQPEEKG